MADSSMPLACPFCGQHPIVEPWHGGAPTKVLISCPGLHPDGEIEPCEVAPSVTGETRAEALGSWNRRAAGTCTCAEVLGEDPSCDLHGESTAWALLNPDPGATAFDLTNAPLIAAAQAGEALVELLRYSREGAAYSSAPFTNEPVQKLVEAALLAARIELAEEQTQAEEERESLGQLAAACARFIEGWAG